MLVFRHLLIFRSKVKATVAVFGKTVSVIIFVSFKDIFLRLCIHIQVAYVCLQTPIDFQVTRSKVKVTVTVFVKSCFRSSVTVWFPIIIFVSFTDILLRLYLYCLCLSWATVWFSGHQVKGQGSCDQFCENHFRSLSLLVLPISSGGFACTLPMLVFRHLLILRSPVHVCMYVRDQYCSDPFLKVSLLTASAAVHCVSHWDFCLLW